MRTKILNAGLLAAIISGCSVSGHTAALHPALPSFTIVHHGVYSAPSVTVTCPPSYPNVTGGGGSGAGGLDLSEPTTDAGGWTVSATPSSSFPTTAYAVCEALQ